MDTRTEMDFVEVLLEECGNFSSIEEKISI